MKKHLLFLFSVLLSINTLFAQRQVVNLNRSWSYVPGWEVSKEVSTTINLPHTWNLDALSGKPDYFRGLANYVKTIDVPASWTDKKVYIRFKGSNQVTDLYVNSKHVGEHRGGYTAFCWDITPYLVPGRNTIWARVTNALDLNVMPLLGDFNMYGGIYRDVELLVLPRTHIAPDDYASCGIYVATPNVSSERADVNVTAKINVASIELTDVKFEIYDGFGRMVDSLSKRLKFERAGLNDVSAFFTIQEPNLWNSTEDPHLYRVAVTVEPVIDLTNITASKKEKRVIEKDSLSVNFGLRYWEVDKDNQFLLNGQKLRIKGVGRQQDWAMVGNALYAEHHQRDVELMKEMGVNAVRLAHYPQDEYFIELCDKAGIMVWSEIPFVGPGAYRDKGFNDSESFMDNGKLQLVEMIRQLYNHPSILWWGMFSEITQRGDDPKNYVKELVEIAKDEDPFRTTVAASNQDGDLNFITDILGFNQYMGWYTGEPQDIKIWATRLRKDWPRLMVGLSEYGAGGSVFQHSDTLRKPVTNSYWHPEQWQTYLHEVYWKNIVQGNYFWGTFAWVMFDYGSAHRTEGLRPGINDMGLVTFDRLMRKDAFYYYKANWNDDERFVYIAERRWQNRPQLKQTLRVFSNCLKVELIVNGISYGTRENDGFGTFEWKDVVMQLGDNEVVAHSIGLTEKDRVMVRITPSVL